MFNDQTIEEIYKDLNTSENGLTDDEVKQRQKENGKNVFPNNNRLGIIKLILNQFKSAIMIILIA